MAAETSANAKAYKTAVIKIGSNTLTDDEGKCDRAYLADLAHQVARVRREGWRVIIVSSGAIPCGLEALGLPLRRPDDMPTVQAAASVGQRALLAAYDQVFSPYGMLTSARAAHASRYPPIEMRTCMRATRSAASWN